MTGMTQRIQSLPVIRLDGLHLDTLGHYFAALGLLRLAARQWPSVKGCWRDGVFCLVGGPADFSELETYLLDVGANNKWTQYEQGWAEKQKKSTDILNKKAAQKKGVERESLVRQATEILALWVADADERDALFFLSHIVASGKRAFNPVFGSGGNAGKRNFSTGWKNAVNAIATTSKFSTTLRQKIDDANNQAEKALAGIRKTGTKKHKNALEKKAAAEQLKRLLDAPQSHLSSLLRGINCDLNPSVSLPKEGGSKQKEPVSFLSKYNAACWFSDANKKYNFSPDKPSCEGQITPWAMLLACEAFPLLVGATSRQLGSAREGTGAFPFVTRGVAPENEKETGTVKGEFWAPVWSNPLSLAEVDALYKRGRAEVNGRGAVTSAAFAAAIIQRGTDAGLAEFRRFSLLQTTSTQTFESRLASIHPLSEQNASSESEARQADAVSRIIRFRDALPNDAKNFSGLQGPIDTALVRLAASADNENAWALLDAVFTSLERTANNKTYRKREPELALLPVSWGVSLLQKESTLTPEIRIALALATLRADSKKDASFDKATAPLLAYRVGVVPSWKNNWRRIKIGDAAKNTPARCMLRAEWCNRPLVDNLAAVIRRRVAVEAETSSLPPFNMRFSLPLADVDAFIRGETDDALVSRWLDRFLLFDWSSLSSSSEEHEALSQFFKSTKADLFTSSETLLYAFFRPFFHAKTFFMLSGASPKANKCIKPTSGMLRSITAHLERGDAATAFSVARNRYKALLVKLADFGENIFVPSDVRRLLAALILPASPGGIVKRFNRFQPQQPQNKE
jgi:CRISPR-associated protein Csx17